MISFIGEPEIGFLDFITKHERIVEIIRSKTQERIATCRQPYTVGSHSAADMLAYCNELFTTRLMASLPPEARASVQALLIQSGIDGMERARRVYGVPFSPPGGYRFEDPAELEALKSQYRGETTPKTPEPERSNLPEDTRHHGGYL